MNWIQQALLSLRIFFLRVRLSGACYAGQRAEDNLIAAHDAQRMLTRKLNELNRIREGRIHASYH